MATLTVNEEKLLDSYWSQLRSFSDTFKRRLAEKLTADETVQSVKGVTQEETDEEYTARFIKTFAGAWRGPETSDEIIARIREDRRSKTEPIPFDF